MNSYTLEQQVEQNNEQYSDIAYKSHMFTTAKKNPLHDLEYYFAGNKTVESIEPDYQGSKDSYDNYVNNNLSYGDNDYGYSFNL